MQIASILSDLTSLRVCDHAAALALVSVHKPQSGKATTGAGQPKVFGSNSGAEEDPDMQRAIDLVELHYGVKMNHMQGEDEGLRQARRDVDRVLEKLENQTTGGVKTQG